MAYQVKDPALSLQHFGLLLWHGFDPSPGNLPRAQLEKKKKDKTEHMQFFNPVKKKKLELPSSSSF